MPWALGVITLSRRCLDVMRVMTVGEELTWERGVRFCPAAKGIGVPKAAGLP
jgi:hypothetical protein